MTISYHALSYFIAVYGVEAHAQTKNEQYLQQAANREAKVCLPLSGM